MHARDVRVRDARAPSRASARLTLRKPGSGGPLRSVLSVQRLAGNRAVSRLVADPVDESRPAGVGARAGLPAGSTASGAGAAQIEADPSLRGGWTEAGGTKLSSGRVGNVDRILLEGLSGSQGSGARWHEGGKARAEHAAAYGPGKSGHRGRAVALVPHGMKADGGPVSIVVHLHGIDVGGYAGSSGMRETGAGPEDVAFFQIPQQLEAFETKHPGGRVVVLMPLGVTYGGHGKGFNVDFGIDDWDMFVTECLARLGVRGAGHHRDAVYMSAHSGGGFTVSALGPSPFKQYRFGGVFGFESFHGDESAWEEIAVDHLEEDLKRLEELRDRGDEAAILRAQLDYLQNEGFRFAAFGGSNAGYTARVRALRKRILRWFRDRRGRLQAAAGGNPQVGELLWRNYQANVAAEGHMQSLSQDSHFESVLESLVSTPGATKTSATTTAPPATKAPPAPTTTPAPAAVGHAYDADHKSLTKDEHKHEPQKPAAVKVKSKAHAAASKRKSVQEPFDYVAWPLWQDPIELAHEFRGTGKKKERIHKRAISAVPAEFMPAILKRANVPNPEDFFKRFVTNLTFLGRPINAPIHEHLALHLRDVEKDFAERFGGPDKDPKVAGDALGLSDEHIAGARQVSATAAISMHMFGLAIDVDHYRNPYLQAAGGLPNKVFTSIRQLMEGKSSGLDLGEDREDTAKKYARLSAFNKMVIDYFALADPAKEDELQKKLDKAVGPWKKRDVKQAREAIQADLEALGYHTQRGKDLPMIRTKGFLQLREEVVRGLKLNWGAWYGDMMHFDMRTDGDIGERISKQIVQYLKKVKAQADAAEAPEHPGAVDDK